MGYSLRKKRGSRELADFQGLLPLSSRMIPDEQEVKQRWQEACMEEQKTPDKTVMKGRHERQKHGQVT